MAKIDASSLYAGTKTVTVTGPAKTPRVLAMMIPADRGLVRPFNDRRAYSTFSIRALRFLRQKQGQRDGLENDPRRRRSQIVEHPPNTEEEPLSRYFARRRLSGCDDDPEE